ncbi:uncharacterized protein F5147DRAFT_758957 [Suillus discolor]|uniref:Uncharacterized protein n=1 Tax=Suillus discolor TaxID=1912936 RepID=A0A9P7FCU8_9AGAM|nr:uncharacterized protein F5147DRAFT_758957 [Suillus discolor]KAG2114292.1 hypothetical protein F5147DRAFT_758957 [Suillus discolor]
MHYTACLGSCDEEQQIDEEESENEDEDRNENEDVNDIERVQRTHSSRAHSNTIVPAAYATSAIPGITGCYRSSTNYWLFILFLLSSVFELGLMIITLIRAIQSSRTNQSRLYVVLVNHNIFYYVCGFLFSVTTVFTLLLLQDTYQTILNGFQFTILATLATRMHLHLWQINQHPHGSTSALVHIPMSDISFANTTE